VLQWIREKLLRRVRRDDVDEGLFPDDRCPCGRSQPRDDRLYCDPCTRMMARQIAPERQEGSEWP
jgi:hypothetical protein